MATAGWRSNSTLKSLVFEHYGRFNVFQLMRLLLWKNAHVDAEAEHGRTPAAMRIDQRLRFSADLSAAFPGREISHLRAHDDVGGGRPVEHAAGAGVIEISTPSFCIAGTLGPLPEPFTEWVRDLKRAREPAMEDFLNIFNQRMNVLRFQLKSRQTLALNNAPPAETAQARYLAALMGMAHPGLAAQVPLPRRAWLGLAGLLSNTRRSAFVVSHVLSEFVGAKTTLEQLVGAWQPIEADNRIALGRNNHRLGQQSTLGRRVWDQQARIRLTVAPIAYDDFCRLLPPNAEEKRVRDNMPAATDAAAVPAFDSFVALMRLLLDRQCDCEVQIQADAATVPPRVLSAVPAPRSGRHRGLRLGQTAWLSRHRREEDAPAADYRAGYLVRAFDQTETA